MVAGLVLHDQLPGQVHGVEHPEPRPRMPGGARRLLEERHVEPGVVRDEHAVAGELEERRQHRLDPRRLRDHRVGDAGEHLDEHGDRLARPDQGLELAEDLAAPDLDRPDLGDRRRGRAAAGGLQVDDDEGDVAQRRAEVVQGALDRPDARAGTPPLPLTRPTVTARSDSLGQARGGLRGPAVCGLSVVGPSVCLVRSTGRDNPRVTNAVVRRRHARREPHGHGLRHLPRARTAVRRLRRHRPRPPAGGRAHRRRAARSTWRSGGPSSRFVAAGLVSPTWPAPLVARREPWSQETAADHRAVG